MDSSLEKYFSLLRSSQLFKGIRADELAPMLACLSVRERMYRKGEYICRSGDALSSVAMVLDGCVHVQRQDYWGNQSILAVVESGELFADSYACSGEPIAVDAVAVKNSAVMFVDVGRITNVCGSSCDYHHKLISNLLSVVASKNRALTAKIQHMEQRTTRGKLMSYLSEQSRKSGGPFFEIPLSRQQLADYLAVDRSAMSSELGKLKGEGVIDFDRNRFKLL